MGSLATGSRPTPNLTVPLAGAAKAPDGPELAVIVGAFSRDRFLLDAVQSVLDQTVDRRRIEIVVTKNFRSEEIERFLKEKGVLTLLDLEPRIGQWLMNAVGHTRAPLIAFLDDDDQFEPERIEAVLELFQRHPHLGFYRNRVSVIYESGASVQKERWKEYQLDSWLDSTGPFYVSPIDKVACLPSVRKMACMFNSSTMVIRRDVLAGSAEHAFEDVNAPDLFLFHAGLSSPYGLYFDDRRLTRYRDHEQPADWEARVAARNARDSDRLLSLYSPEGPPEFLRWIEDIRLEWHSSAYSKAVQGLVRNGAAKRDVARLVANRLRTRSTSARVTPFGMASLFASASAITYIISPASARAMGNLYDFLRHSFQLRRM